MTSDSDQPEQQSPRAARPWYRRKRWWIAGIAIPLALYYLYFRDGFSDVATWSMVFLNVPLVDAPKEFYELCAEQSGTEIHKTIPDVEGLVFHDYIALKGDTDQRDFPPVLDRNDIGRPDLVWTGVRLTPGFPAYLFETYGYVEAYVGLHRWETEAALGREPRLEPGLYRFERVPRAGNDETCRLFEKRFPDRKDYTRTIFGADSCLRITPIEHFTARYEFVSDYFAIIRRHRTLISRGFTARYRKFVRDRETGEILATTTIISFSDSVGGGVFAGPKPCPTPVGYFSPDAVLMPRAASPK